MRHEGTQLSSGVLGSILGTVKETKVRQTVTQATLGKELPLSAGLLMAHRPGKRCLITLIVRKTKVLFPSAAWCSYQQTVRM